MGSRHRGGVVEHAVRLCSELERRGLHTFPLAWNLSSADLCAKADDASRACRELIESRTAQYGDTFCPMGLTGASNQAMHIAEIESEIEWSISNIWGTGAHDTLKHDPPLIIPARPDVLRPDSRAVYSRARVPVGIVGEAQNGLWLTVVENGNDALGRAFPLVEVVGLRPEEIEPRSLTRQIRRSLGNARPVTGTETAVVLHFPMTSPEDDERLCATLAAVAERTDRSSWTVGQMTLENAAHISPPAILPANALGITPATGADVTALRRRRGSKINTRRILERLAYPAEVREPADPPETPQAGKREFVASMMGQTSIPGTAIEAVFAGGRLCGLHGESAAPQNPHPATSFLRTHDGDMQNDAVTSCFSFESEISRGLRSESTITGEDNAVSARIRSEYSFVGEYDALVSSHHVLVDGGSPDDTLCVLGVPILHRHQCAITGRFSDGSTYDYDASWDRRELVLYGEAFQIWDGESCYTLVPVTSRGHPFPWTVTLLSTPEPRVVLGGRYEMGRRTEHSLSFLLVRGELDDELVARAFSGRLPSAITTEIAAGTAAELSIRRRRPQAPQEV